MDASELALRRRKGPIDTNHLTFRRLFDSFIRHNDPICRYQRADKKRQMMDL